MGHSDSSARLELHCDLFCSTRRQQGAYPKHRSHPSRSGERGSPWTFQHCQAPKGSGAVGAIWRGRPSHHHPSSSHGAATASSLSSSFLTTLRPLLSYAPTHRQAAALSPHGGGLVGTRRRGRCPVGLRVRGQGPVLVARHGGGKRGRRGLSRALEGRGRPVAPKGLHARAAGGDGRHTGAAGACGPVCSAVAALRGRRARRGQGESWDSSRSIDRSIAPPACFAWGAEPSVAG